MTYVRPNMYPDGQPIASELPPSYQPTWLGETPAGQSCRTCLAFNISDKTCAKWAAPVRGLWWCAAWTARPPTPAAKNSTKETAVLKRVITNSVEEHFDTTANVAEPVPKSANEEDIIKFNIPFLILMLEWARETAKDDVDLHRILERLVDMSEDGDVLTVKVYDDVVAPVKVKQPRFPQ